MINLLEPCTTISKPVFYKYNRNPDNKIIDVWCDFMQNRIRMTVKAWRNSNSNFKSDKRPEKYKNNYKNFTKKENLYDSLMNYFKVSDSYHVKEKIVQLIQEKRGSFLIDILPVRSKYRIQLCKIFDVPIKRKNIKLKKINAYQDCIIHLNS
jgi:hypothetical protein